MHQRREIQKQNFFQMPVRGRVGVNRVVGMVDLVEQRKVVCAVGVNRQLEYGMESLFAAAITADDSAVARHCGLDLTVVQVVAAGSYDGAGTVSDRRICNRAVDAERQRAIPPRNEIRQRIGAGAMEELRRDIIAFGIPVEAIGSRSVAVRLSNVVWIFLTVRRDRVELEKLLGESSFKDKAANLLLFHGTANARAKNLRRDEIDHVDGRQKVRDDEVRQFLLAKQIERTRQCERIDADAAEIRA